jgi:predicted GNAT family acetyltransferase
VDLNLSGVAVIHNEDAHRFEAQVDGLRSLMNYRRFPDRLVVTHTEVPPPLQGHGLAGKLARNTLDFARANKLRVVPLCPFLASYIRNHAEYQDLLAPEDLQRLISGSRGAATP